MSKQTLLVGTAILVAASLFNRILGFAYQIFIIDLIGTKGIGLFNMVFPIYILAIVIATAGIPLAIAKFVAEENANNNPRAAFRILQISLIFLTLSSLTACLILYLAIPLLEKHVFPNPDAIIVFKVLIPGVFIVSICSAFRGYFQGLMQMTPTAITQVIEQITRVLFGFIFAKMFLPHGIAYAAMGAAIGVIIGEFIGLLVMLVFYWKKRPNIPKPSISSSIRFTNKKKARMILKGLLTLSLPVTFTRVISTIILSIEATMIPNYMVRSGISLDEATNLYGQLTGIALPILVIPSVITASLATAIVPAVSEAYAKQNGPKLYERISEALRVTFLTGFPAVTIFFLLGSQITDMLFKNPGAGEALRILALGGIFYYLQQTTSAILQGLGEAAIPMRNLIIASILEFIGIIILVPIPGIGLNGAAWAINISFAVVAILNLWSIIKRVGLSLSLSNLILKPTLSAITLGLTLYFMYREMFIITQHNTISTILALILGLIMYTLILFITGALKGEDLQRIPYLGPKLRTLVKKVYYFFFLKRYR